MNNTGGDSYLADIEGLGSYFSIENWMYVNPLQDADANKLSKSEKDTLDDSINKYGTLSYDEIKEKSHGIVWRCTAKDFSIQWDDIAREAGLNSDELLYLNEISQLQTALN